MKKLYTQIYMPNSQNSNIINVMGTEKKNKKQGYNANCCM